ncbi:MAG TPA: glycerate kinase [Tepidisphaeraceae bacterium]|jgi:glycerate kinase|nr:glycerate kinase [Tepidisphaeraceae bacterium]
MRVLIAPDKFKGCLTAIEVARAMETGARRAAADALIDICPMADGGEGTVQTLVAATSGRFVTRSVTGPLPEMKVEARFGILGDGKTAVIEMAAASGLALLAPGDRDPMRTTTFGTGQLLMAAAEMGMSRIILGIGGSATIDGGIGCAQACGLPVILEEGELVSPGEPLVGADVKRVVLIKHGRGSAIERVRIDVACDVSNPLCGKDGAAAVYGPQKGATPQQVRELDAALLELARRNDKLQQANLPGAGAAGGLGFAMAAFFGATLKSGIEIVIDAVGLRRRLAGADVCLTGEGRLDRSSLRGKVVGGVAQACGARGIPCIVLAGSIEAGVEFHAWGITAVGLRDGRMTLEQSMREAEGLIAMKVESILRTR